MNYKYDLFTIFIVVITLTILSIGALMLGHFMGDVGSSISDTANELVEDGLINQSNADFATDFVENDTQKFSDNFVFWIFVITFVGIIVAALYLEFEPATMIIIFVVGLMGVFGAWLGSSVYSGFTEDTDIATTSGAMSKTTLLMGSPYFPIFIFTALIVMMVIMYNKKQAGEYQ